MPDLVARVLGSEARSFEGVDEWWAWTRSLGLDVSWEWAAIAGAGADRLGWAFASGYDAALTGLFERRRPELVAALCVTEEGPPHPRSIATRSDGGRLTGVKRFVTFGQHAGELLVLAKASSEHEASRPSLEVVSIDAAAPGVRIEALPATPFVPEIPHGAVHFDGAQGTVLEGDGWTDYVKPFRSYEDAHVHLATTSWLVARGRRFGFSETMIEEGCALIGALGRLAAGDPSDAATHLALAGAMSLGERWIERLDWGAAPEPDRARWLRDRRLLTIAARAREARRVRAWERLAAQ